MHLVRRDRPAQLALGLRPPVRGEVAHTDVAHDARVLESAHARHRRAKRDQGIRPVHLVQVDALDAEPQGREAPVLLDAPRGRPHREHLRRDERLVATTLESAAHDRFGRAARVHLGGVDEVHPQVERAVHELGGRLLAVGLAVSPVTRAELPAPQTDGRESQLACFDVLHRTPCSSSRVLNLAAPHGTCLVTSRALDDPALRLARSRRCSGAAGRARPRAEKGPWND